MSCRYSRCVVALTVLLGSAAAALVAEDKAGNSAPSASGPRASGTSATVSPSGQRSSATSPDPHQKCLECHAVSAANGSGPRLALDPRTLDVKRLAAEARVRGGAARGEEVYRHNQIKCHRCHALAGCGAAVGPDHMGLGVRATTEEIIRSLLSPNKVVGDEYQALTIATTSGEILNGIVRAKDDRRIVLRDVDDRQIVIETADIDESARARTLMPDGLCNYLSRQQLLDMVWFLAQLGKPGPWGVPDPSLIRTWRVFSRIPQRWQGLGVIEQGTRLFADETLQWRAAYGRLDGKLPLADIGLGPQAFVRGRFRVRRAGNVAVKIEDIAGLTVWIDTRPTPVSEKMVLDLQPGLHTVCIHVDKAKRNGKALRVAVSAFPGASAEVCVVTGS